MLFKYDDDVNVTITSEAITIKHRDYCEAIELLDKLNDLSDDANDAIIDAMPNDYEFIMHECENSVLFALNSPQIFERSWQISVLYNYDGTTLTITNFG